MIHARVAVQFASRASLRPAGPMKAYIHALSLRASSGWFESVKNVASVQMIFAVKMLGQPGQALTHQRTGIRTIIFVAKFQVRTVRRFRTVHGDDVVDCGRLIPSTTTSADLAFEAFPA